MSSCDTPLNLLVHHKSYHIVMISFIKDVIDDPKLFSYIQSKYNNRRIFIFYTNNFLTSHSNFPELDDFDVYYVKRSTLLSIDGMVAQVVHTQFRNEIGILEWSNIIKKLSKINRKDIDQFDDNFRPHSSYKSEIFDINLSRLHNIEKNYNQLLNDLGYNKYIVIAYISNLIQDYFDDSINDQMDKYYITFENKTELDDFLKKYHRIDF